MSKPFSVVIPTCNNRSLRRGSLRAVLASLDSACDVIQEVIVVDNASSDGGLHVPPGTYRNRIVRTEYPDQPHIGAARNLGVSYAQAPWIVFVDDDTIVLGDSLRRLASQVRQDAFWTCAQRRYVPWATPMGQVLQAAQRQELSWLLQHSTPVPGLEEPSQRFQVLYRLSFIGCFGIVPRRLFDAVGGFDPQFSGWGGEDTDLMIRLFDVAPLVSLFGDHVCFHLDHVLSPYKLVDRARASHRLGEKLHAQGRDFNIVTFSEAVVAGHDVSRWNTKVASAGPNGPPVGHESPSPPAWRR